MNVKIPFALNKEGRIVTAFEVERGLACKCTCLECDRPLLARHPKKRIVKHFAHQSSSANSGCGEGTIHKVAKAAITNSIGKYLELPSLPDISGPLRGRHRTDSGYYKFRIRDADDEVLIPIVHRRCDVKATLEVVSASFGRPRGQRRVERPKGERVVCIEINVNNAKDEHYRADMKSINQAAIEIDVPPKELWAAIERYAESGHPRKMISVVKSMVLSWQRNRRWLHFPRRRGNDG